MQVIKKPRNKRFDIFLGAINMGHIDALNIELATIKAEEWFRPFKFDIRLAPSKKKVRIDTYKSGYRIGV